MKKTSKKAVISALLIGILGSAIWEKILSPFCTFIYIKLSSLIDEFNTSFSNNAYCEISKGYDDSIVVTLLYRSITIILLLLLLFYFYYIVNRETTSLTPNNNEIINRIYKKNNLKMQLIKLVIFFSLLCFLLIIFVYWVGSLTFIVHCRTTSLCNLEIICPYISDLEYKELKSSFYSIQTKEDYEAFTNAIKEIGEKYSLNLKE